MNVRAGMGWLVGVGFVLMPLWTVARDLELRSIGVEAAVIRVEPARNKQSPAAVVLDRDGVERRCPGWGIEVGDPVLYDPVDPGRCRAAAHVGWPAPEEWLMLGGGLLVLFVGALAALHPGEAGRRLEGT